MVSQMAQRPYTVREGDPKEGLVARSAPPLPSLCPPLAPLQHRTIFCLFSPFINSFQALLAPLPPIVCIELLRHRHGQCISNAMLGSTNLPVDQLDACEVHMDSDLSRSMMLDPDTCCCFCRVM